MKHLEKVGFVATLIGAGGLAEAYPDPKQFAIAISLIIIGGILIFIGDLYNDVQNQKKHTRRNKHLKHLKYHDGSRPYFLR